jgi:anti-sigma regulatory factor (Ser/Thr protein kinase)
MLLRIHLLAGDGAACEARRAVRAALSAQPPELVETAVLLTSELVTNAVVHAGDSATLVIESAERVARIEVVDPGHATYLAPLRLGPSSESGRGLAIVEDLADAWGVDSRVGGKAVWFELGL